MIDGSPAIKRFWSGCQRAEPPARTLERILPLAADLGITRVANVTGLDEIGIPVVMVVRPQSRSLTVSQGKGVSLEAAKVSGLMESLELHHAERPARPLCQASYDELRRRMGADSVADPYPLLASPGRGINPTMRFLWVEGRGAYGQQPIWLPLEAVHADCVIDCVPDWGRFQMSSNGLASGNHYLEALAHGLSELIERDALVRWLDQSPARRAPSRVRLETVDDEEALGLLAKYQQAGIEVVVWEITSELAVPAFCTEILSRQAEPWHPQVVYAGMGCHLDKGIALVRSLTEAAQSRLTAISGSRDDMSRRSFRAGRRPQRLDSWRRRIDAAPPVRSFADIEGRAGNDFRTDVDRLLDRLKTAGHSEPMVVDLTRPEIGVPVVKVVAPTLLFRHNLDQSDEQSSGGVSSTRSPDARSPAGSSKTITPADNEPRPKAKPTVEPSQKEKPVAKRVVLFIGPTLAGVELKSPPHSGITWQVRAPAAQGDIYLAAREKPWAIALVDGYFERLPAVWHKEILWAMEQGIHVFGAASMGALRAAELSSYGMVGVGKVFQAFQNRDLDDDDEVTLIHGPEESGYLALSEAMVNIRATLEKAQQQGIINSADRQALIRRAKATFYPHRAWSRLRQTEVGKSCTALWSWLDRGNGIDQKHRDFLALVETVQRQASEDLPPVFRAVVENTSMWRDLRRESAARSSPDLSRQDRAVTAELRIVDPELYRHCRDWARARLVALGRLPLGNLPDTTTLRPTVQEFRRRFGLTDSDATDRWLAEQWLDGDRLLDLLSDQHRLNKARPGRSSILDRQICDLLRLQGRYGFWHRRAKEKEKEKENERRSETISDEILWQRYFNQCLGRQVPESVTAWAAQLDFSDLESFRRQVLDELSFRQASEHQ